MAKVYVVEGTTGEYEDRNDWFVKAFLNEEKASGFARACNEAYAYLVSTRPEGSLRWDDERKHPLDPYFMEDYTGTSYTYLTIDLED